MSEYIEVHCNHGQPRRVRVSKIVRGLALHRDLDRRTLWTVTHVGTGRPLRRGRDYSHANRIMSVLVEDIDWTENLQYLMTIPRLQERIVFVDVRSEHVMSTPKLLRAYRDEFGDVKY